MSNLVADASESRPYLRYAVHAGTIALFASTLIYFGYREFSRYSMKAMNCTKLSAEDFDKRLTNRLLSPIYTPKPNLSASPVTFRLNFSPTTLSDTVLVIKSSKVQSDIYRGEYRDEFVVQAGADLLSDGGGDSFELRLFNRKTYEACTAVHESERFWQANKKVYMDLLPSRELNTLGLPVSFKVRIE